MTAQHLSKLLLKRDKQVLDYLLSIADSEGNLTDSTYAIAHDLGIHRQILSRILRRLARTGAVTLDNHACRPIRVTDDVTGDVTGDVTQSMSQSATDDAASTSYRIGSWSVTYTIFSVPKYASENAENDTLVTGAVTSVVTSAVTNKKETKQQNEEISPAPPKEEKKQKKEKSPTNNACARKEISTKIDDIPLEMRRQHFVDSLLPYAERYGQEMIEDFAEYWTETNHSNTRMRFELKRAWNTSRRLAKWTKMDDVYHPLPNTKHHAYNTRHAYTNHHAYYTHHGYYTHQRRTSADYIREAQEQAIIENEKFIREAERRRGGAPPHLPF